jgi:hypothetical protein
MAQTETRRRVSDYSIDDAGIINPQYWQGVSTVYTKWRGVYTGTGDNAHDALNDALDLAAMDAWNVDAIPNTLPDAPTVCALCMELVAEFGIDDAELDMDAACSCCEMSYCVTLWVA